MERNIKKIDGFVLSSREYGAKVANLSVISTMGCYIPESYTLPVHYFKAYCRFNKIDMNSKALSNKKEYLLPDYVEEELRLLWNILEHNAPLVVRSSADGEDGDALSFAGIYSSVISVCSFYEFINAIKTVWNSFFSRHAYEYRNDFSISSEGMGVLIQPLVKGEYSGVIFTNNPVNQDANEMLIELVNGPNINLVDNQTYADYYLFRRKEMFKEYDLIDYKSNVPIDKKILWDMCIIADKIAWEMRYPCDIEWTVCNGRIYILQTRPITVSLQGSLYSSAPMSDAVQCNLIDRYANPVCTLYLSLLEYWQENVYLDMSSTLTGSNFSVKPLLFYYNRVYWNLEYQRKYFDGKSDNKISLERIKQISEEWYGRIPKYEEKITYYSEELDARYGESEIYELIKEIMKNFYGFIGIDHYQILGITNICYSRLYKILNSFGNCKEIIDRLIQSYKIANMTNISNDQLSELSRYVIETSELKKIFLEEDLSCISLYMQSEYFSTFTKKFNSFLRVHGHRGISCDDLLDPHWIEEPINVLRIIQQYVRLFDKHDRYSDITFAGYSPENILNNISEEKVISKEEKKDILDISYLLAEYMALRENQRYYFDKSWLLLRKAFLRISECWCKRGYLFNVEDIFWFTLREIDYVIHRGAFIINNDWQKRKSLYKRSYMMKAPYFIHDGEAMSVQKEGHKKSYKVTSVSQGISEGKVRVIRSINDIGSVEEREIIVVSTFHPSWTPVLKVINGMIMNFGNILSHGCVIAREYNVPVVSFNGMATEEFENGQKIHLDAIRGRIHRM
jgi:phosphohistidine swiveling domain-containing protein